MVLSAVSTGMHVLLAIWVLCVLILRECDVEHWIQMWPAIMVICKGFISTWVGILGLARDFVV